MDWQVSCPSPILEKQLKHKSILDGSSGQLSSGLKPSSSNSMMMQKNLSIRAGAGWPDEPDWKMVTMTSQSVSQASSRGGWGMEAPPSELGPLSEFPFPSSF
jgi:hypothetical protein